MIWETQLILGLTCHIQDKISCILTRTHYPLLLGEELLSYHLSPKKNKQKSSAGKEQYMTMEKQI